MRAAEQYRTEDELSARIDALTDLIEDEVVPLIRALAYLAELDPPPPAPQPKGERHLRLVKP